MSWSHLGSKIIIATLKTEQNTMLASYKTTIISRISYCIAGFKGSPSSQASLTSRTISSIHFLSAAVRATNRSSFGLRNSTVAFSVCEGHVRIRASMFTDTNIDKQIYFLLLRDDGVGAST